MGVRKCCIVVVTAPAEIAKNISKVLLREKLIACCNISTVESIYTWNDSIEQNREAMMTMKTCVDVYKPLEEFIRTQHPYEVPEIIMYEINGSEQYLNYIRTNVKDSLFK